VEGVYRHGGDEHTHPHTDENKHPGWPNLYTHSNADSHQHAGGSNVYANAHQYPNPHSHEQRGGLLGGVGIYHGL
jgi:hypothetical protein